MAKYISQGNIYMCEFEGAKGCEQMGIRPCICVQNNIGNTFSNTTWVIPITSQIKKDLPTHHILYKKDYPKLSFDKNVVLVEQLTTRDKCRIKDYICKLQKKDLDIVIEKIINNLSAYK